MSIEKMREEFETWASSPEFGLRGGHFARGEDGEYLNYPTQCYFMVWQASRAAIEVELPSAYEFSASDSPGYVIEKVSEAIESLGLKVKA